LLLSVSQNSMSLTGGFYHAVHPRTDRFKFN
jgi:hypothetical protein